MQRSELVRVARQMAERYGLDPEIFVKQIQQESGFNPAARNKRTGATGLGQVMSATAQDPGYGVTPLRDRLDPVENLRFSAEYMSKMLEKFDGSYPLALAAYNAGPGVVQKTGGIPEFQETQDYVQKILAGPTRPQARPTTQQDAIDAALQEAMAEGPIDPSAMTPADRAVAEYLAQDGGPTLRAPSAPGLTRTQQMSRMSPLSNMPVRGLQSIQQYSTPGIQQVQNPGTRGIAGLRQR